MPVEDIQFDPEELQKKYDEERDKRLRPDGTKQYIATKGEFAYYEQDPYTNREEREPIVRQVEVAILGGGFGGLLAAARLKERGIDDLLVIEKGGDFGGTWYWNRYPGAACDVESYTYLPLLEETGYMPAEKYARAPEIVEHTGRIASHFGLYERALFQTAVTEILWHEESHRWHVHTDRGDRIEARFFIIASGPLQEPKLPGIKGIEKFKGHSFHTSRWDYGYTGGDASGGLEKLKDKRVGIIGTGATAIQCVPHLGRWAKQLYVFQRTPSAVNFRGDRPTDRDWAASLTPGWQRRRMDNFTNLMMGMPVEEDLVQDSWTKPVWDLMHSMPADAPMDERMAQMQTADYRGQEMVRRRVDEIIENKDTADALKPWYNRLCKRPTFHDDYLPTFNRPNVELVDTLGRGVDEITENAVIVAGKEYEIDCLIFATGFEVAAFTGRATMPVIGRDGVQLTEKWKEGATTLHGIHVHGFPNLFILSTTQSAWGPNFPHMMAEQAIHISHIIDEVRTRGADTVEVTAEAETAWVDHHEQLAPIAMDRWVKTCPPSYFNEEGNATAKTLRSGPYGGGVPNFVKALEDWRAKGDLDGLVLDSAG